MRLAKEPGFGATANFKLWIMILLFFLTGFHLFEAYNYPQTTIVPGHILLIAALIPLAYLWIKEIQDRHRLLNLYKELFNTQDDLKHANLETISALVMAEETKDPYTRGHSRRVMEYSLALARKLGLDDEGQKAIAYSCILHDIGKIGVDESILGKREKLSEKEWEIIREHPRKGRDILQSLKFLTNEREIIHYHHERYDGKGYPSGIKGKNIPIGSRILAIADAFDAMRSKRPYRDAMNKEKIVNELKAGAGTQFDPDLVESFLKLLDEHNELWEK